jgi:hypothetical protein
VFAVLFPAGSGLAAELHPPESRPAEGRHAVEVTRGQPARLESGATRPLGVRQQGLVEQLVRARPEASERRRIPAASRAARTAAPVDAVAAAPAAEAAAAPADVTAAEAAPADAIGADEVVPPPAPFVPPPGAPGAHPASTPTPFAAVAGQPLLLPGPVVGVGFHESGSPRALPLTPVGMPTTNLNAPKIELPPAAPGPEYMVMPTRRRPHGATTAVDLRMDHGVTVTSPVDGTVETVADYPLYGRFPDQLIEIVPEGRPDLLVRVLHVEGATVEAGQTVVAAETAIASTTRQLPFGSQIDRYSGEGPHVHIEVIHRPEHAAVEAAE